MYKDKTRRFYLNSTTVAEIENYDDKSGCLLGVNCCCSNHLNKRSLKWMPPSLSRGSRQLNL